MKKIIFYSSLIISSTIYLCTDMYIYLYPSTYDAPSDITAIFLGLRYIAIIVLIYAIVKSIMISSHDK